MALLQDSGLEVNDSEEHQKAILRQQLEKLEKQK